MKKILAILIVGSTFQTYGAAQSSTSDSVQMDIKVYSYENVTDGWFNCGAGVYATWPDDAARALNKVTSYSTYRLVATEGMFVPRGYGEAVNNPELGIGVPEGNWGHNPQLASSKSGPNGVNASDGCGRMRAGAQAAASGKEALLNGSPFRVTDWYAVYSIPAGTVIANFDWDQTGTTDVRFDGGFPSSREVDVDGRKPVAAYEWSLGDGNTMSSPTFTHTYAEPGTYTVSLTVTDDDDQTDTETKEIKVDASVLEYRVFASERVSAGDTLRIFSTIRNVGTSRVDEISVSRNIVRLPKYLSEVSFYVKDAESNPLKPYSDTTYSNVEAGQAVTVYQDYLITKTAEDVIDAVRVPIPVDWEYDLVNLRGVDENGEKSKIINLCETRECDVTRIELKELNVSVLSTTIDGERADVNAGLKRRVSILFPNGRFDHLLKESLTADLECNSGCVDLEINVQEPDGTPVEGAVVKLTRTLLDSDPAGKSIVTPDQGGGVFCFESDCATELELPPTDAEGKQTARFWVPGVTDRVTAYIEAEATKEGFAITPAEDRVVEILPTLVDFVPQSANPTETDMTVVTIIGSLHYALKIPDLEFLCNKLLEWASETDAKTAGLQIEGVWKTGVAKGISYTCGKSLDKYVFDQEFASTDEKQLHDDKIKIVRLVQDVVDLLGVYWFQGQFEFSLKGTGTTSLTKSPPFISHSSQFVDVIKEVNLDIAYQSGFSGSSVPPTLLLDLHEVSHNSKEGKYVRALHFALKTTPDLDPKVDFKKLIAKDYNKSIFLTQERIEATTATAVSESDQSLSLSSSSGKQKAADDSTFSVGHIVVIDPGLESQEFSQIVSINGSSVGLSVPLKYNHGAGAVVAYSDSLGIEAPGSPISSTGVSGMNGYVTTPELTWRFTEPFLSYTVEVATDSLFENIVDVHTNVAEARVTIAQLDDRTRYYWRVAATNQSGQGEWSDWYSFFTGRPIGDDLSEAHPMTDEFGAIRFAWQSAETAEPGEVMPTCGTGDNSRWYSYDPSATGRVAFETFDSGFNTELSIWTGTSHPLTEVACNDDYENGTNATIQESYVAFDATAGTRYYIRVTGHDNAKGALFLSLRAPTAVSTEELEVPIIDTFEVNAFPNPTSGLANIVIENPKAGKLTVEIYNTLGQRLAVLADGQVPTGKHEFVWNPSGFPAGLYFVVARGGHGQSNRVTRPLTIVK